MEVGQINLITGMTELLSRCVIQNSDSGITFKRHCTGHGLLDYGSSGIG